MLKADVLAHFGGTQVSVAKAIGITKSAVNQWDKRVPLKMALRLQHVTNGALRVNMSDYDLPEFSSQRTRTGRACVGEAT